MPIRKKSMTLDRTGDLGKQRLPVHAYIDRLPGDQLTAVYSLLEAMLSPLDRKLALAPIDDEPVTPEDKAAIQAGVASLERGLLKALARFLETEAGNVKQ